MEHPQIILFWMLKFESRVDGRTLGEQQGLPVINSKSGAAVSEHFPFFISEMDVPVRELGWEATSKRELDVARNRTRQRRDSWDPAARFLPTKSSLARSSGSAGFAVFCLLLPPLAL
jgi:hypothetical protein